MARISIVYAWEGDEKEEQRWDEEEMEMRMRFGLGFIPKETGEKQSFQAGSGIIKFGF